MKDKKSFGTFIKQKRIEKNYSQKDLAELLFVTESAVSKWERGVTYPDITLISDLCRALDVTEHELIDSSNDTEYREMRKEADEYKKLKKTLFWTLNISYLIALVTCFIVNLAVNHTLSWFFIVLTSICCAYTFCPTVTWAVTKYKKIVFIGSTFISLFLLFLTCSIYSENYWFMVATLGVLIGYFVLFYPILFVEQKKYLSEKKYKDLFKLFVLSYFSGILVLLVLLLVAIYGFKPYNLGLGLIISGSILIIPIAFGAINLFENGKKVNKIFAVSLVSVLVVGLTISIIASISLIGSKETNTYNFEGSYNDVKIELDEYDINIYRSENNENQIVCKENKKTTIEYKVVDGVLIIKEIDNRGFFENILDFGMHLEIYIYLSNTSIDLLTINADTSDIEIHKGFIFKNVDIKNSTGDIKFTASVLENLSLSNSTGNKEIKDSEINGNVSITSSTGKIKMLNTKCASLNIKSNSGDVELSNVLVIGELKLESSTGDVKLDSFDAGNIYIKTSTGDVKGTILSEKIFVVKTSSGSAIYPETFSGGVCKIETSSGSVNISYK